MYSILAAVDGSGQRQLASYFPVEDLTLVQTCREARCLLRALDAVDLVIAGASLVDGSGVEVLAHAREQRPWARRVLLCQPPPLEAPCWIREGLLDAVVPHGDGATLRRLIRPRPRA